MIRGTRVELRPATSMSRSYGGASWPKLNAEPGARDWLDAELHPRPDGPCGGRRRRDRARPLERRGRRFRRGRSRATTSPWPGHRCAIRRELVARPPPAAAGLESVAPRDDVVAKQKPNKPVLGVALVVHVTAATLTWRNLRNRPGRPGARQQDALACRERAEHARLGRVLALRPKLGAVAASPPAPRSGRSSAAALRAARSRVDDAPRRHFDPGALAGAARRGDPDGDLLELAELLDGAGFAYLEVSGGGVFDSAVRRGVESPWERIRALGAGRRRRSCSPCAAASSSARGRSADDLVRRFMASAAASGIDVFRLHDPLNDAGNLRVAAEAIAGRRARVRRRPPVRLSRHDALRRDREAAARDRRRPDRARRSRRPAPAASGRRAGRRAPRADRASPSASTPGGGPERARARARGGAGGRRPDRLRRLPGRARDASDLGGGARAGARGHRARHRASTSTRSGGAADLVDEHIGDMPITPLAAADLRPRRAPQAPGRARRGHRRAAARAHGAATGSTRCSTRSSASASRPARRRSRRRSGRSSPRRRS